MHITIGTNNQAKIAVITHVASELLKDATVTVEGIDIESGVPDTPRDEQTKRGAYNRAMGAIEHADSTYGVGLESGLVQRYSMWFEEAWACIVTNDATFYGYSSGLKIPDYVLAVMEEHDLEHGPAMRKIRSELGGVDERDTWGTYSDKLILRNISLQEAFRNALIQVVTSKNSLYHI